MNQGRLKQVGRSVAIVKARVLGCRAQCRGVQVASTFSRSEVRVWKDIFRVFAVPVPTATPVQVKSSRWNASTPGPATYSTYYVRRYLPGFVHADATSVVGLR